jgi:hypothetical protein
MGRHPPQRPSRPHVAEIRRVLKPGGQFIGMMRAALWDCPALLGSSRADESEPHRLRRDRTHVENPKQGMVTELRTLFAAFDVRRRRSSPQPTRLTGEMISRFFRRLGLVHHAPR